MTQRITEPTSYSEPRGAVAVTVEDQDSKRSFNVPATTKCVSAGPKYRARDRGGQLHETQIDARDLVTLSDTVLGAVVYLRDPGDGRIPVTYRLRKVIAGRPNRAAGAP